MAGVPYHPRMLRQALIKRGTEAEPDFVWRGGDVSRIESLSDAVFAFSLTISGVMYAFIGFSFWIHGSIRGKRREPLRTTVLAERKAEA